MALLLIVAGLFVLSRVSQGKPILMPRMPMTKPSLNEAPGIAGTQGTGATNPFDSLSLLAGAIFGPQTPYVSLSGPGGATADPGRPPSPAGTPSSTIVADAPATWGVQNGIMPVSLADPAFGALAGPLEVIMTKPDLLLTPELAASLLDPSIVLS